MRRQAEPPLAPERKVSPVGIGPIISGRRAGEDSLHVDLLYRDGTLWRIYWDRSNAGTGKRLKTIARRERSMLVEECRRSGPVVVAHDRSSFEALIGLVNGSL
ncbi:MAG: hypothetical protein ABF876_05500 [Acetobacter aceti]